VTTDRPISDPSPLPRGGSGEIGRRDTAAPPDILVIDDCADICDLVCTILLADGFQAVGFTTPDQAYKAVHALARNIRLLIIACEMPRMSGRKLANWLLQRQPQSKVILMSSADECGAQLPGALILRKPFAPEDLRALMREALRN